MSEEPAPYNVRPLAAGRDLDALIAEQVMGLTDLCPNMNEVDRCPGVDYVGNGTICGICTKLVTPPYSTEIEEAWQVFERFPYRYVFFSEKAGVWECKLQVKDHGDYLPMDCYCHADTAPLVICLAALKAIEPPLTAP